MQFVPSKGHRLRESPQRPEAKAWVRMLLHRHTRRGRSGLIDSLRNEKPRINGAFLSRLSSEDVEWVVDEHAQLIPAHVVLTRFL